MQCRTFSTLKFLFLGNSYFNMERLLSTKQMWAENFEACDTQPVNYLAFSSQVKIIFHYTYVSRIRKQETAKRPCGHQSQLHLVAIYLKILKVINLVMTYNKQTKINTNKKAQTG